MIIKAVIVKKLATIAVLAASAWVDGRTANQAHRHGAREVNPFVKPFIGTPGVYAITQTDVAISALMLALKPRSTLTKAVVVGTLAGHGVGILSNVKAHPEITWTCKRYGPGGADVACN